MAAAIELHCRIVICKNGLGVFPLQKWTRSFSLLMLKQQAMGVVFSKNIVQSWIYLERRESIFINGLKFFYFFL